MSKKTTIITVSALAALALIAGAAVAVIGPGAIAPEAKPTESSAPVEDSSSIEGLSVGDVLTEEQARPLGRNYNDKTAQPFKLPDGTEVLISSEEPLPESVRTALTEKFAGLVGGSPSVEATTAVLQAAKWAQAQTGRQIVVVTESYGHAGYGADGVPYNGNVWIATGPWATEGVPGFATRDAAFAQAQKVVASQENPGSWEIIG
ncbi:hypothetical protein [Homoserinimonas hongtaonis]|uniref:hypothetical protein n=1 Tax=Homoserinimonas hongtaonis TaxID=2079791 RepID=UPI000D3A4E72|nr:hypothetical protein [Salinibacterium hongtaonis]AWB90312.1 hypothetical protein C2138_12810 [Salinibacterium hongtaonis]